MFLTDLANTIHLPEPTSQNPTSADEAETEDTHFSSDSKAYDQFKQFARTSQLEDVVFEANKLMQLMGLGKIEKGALDMKAKYNSRNGRWYNSEPKKKTTNDNQDDSGLFLQRDSRVMLQMKRGGAVELASYKVLSLFTKSSNKWFVSEEDKFAWVNGSASNGKGRVLARLVKSVGSSFKEVELEKDGAYGPHHVFQCVPFDKIVSVESKLCDM